MKILRWLNPRNWFNARVGADGSWSVLDILGSNTKSGVVISPNNALQIPVVWSCIKVLSDSVSNLPLKIYEEKDGLRVISESTEHEIRRIKRPHQYLSMTDFLKFSVTQIGLYGNACGIIKRNVNKEPVQIIAVDWSLITIVQNDDGTIFYEVSTDDGLVPVSYENMLHFKVFTKDGIIGLSPVMQLAETMGLASISRDWAASFMRSGGWAGGYLIYDQFLTSEQQKQIDANVPNIKRDGQGAIGKVGIVQGGPKLERIGISPKDSQFIESRQFTDEEIASAYGVPMWLINRMRNNSYVGSGLEQQVIQFVTFGLNTYLKAIEEELNYKLFLYSTKLSKPFVEFTRQALMQMDSKARSEFYKTALGGSGGSGWLSVNRVRDLENEPPLEGEQYNEVVVWSLNDSKGDENADE